MPRRARGSLFWSDARNRFIARITMPDGKRRSFLGPLGNATATARRTLQLRLDAHAAALESAGVKPGVSRFTIGTYVIRYIERDDLAPKTQQWYRGLYDRYVAGSRLAAMELAAVEPRDVRAFFGDFDGVGVPTVRGIFALLNATFAVAVREERIALSPMRVLRKPAHQRRERQPWTPEEVATFLAAARATPHYAVFLVMLTTTCGPAETFGLQRDDVSLDGGYILVRNNLVETASSRALGPTKTRHRRRRISLPPIAVAALRTHLESHASPFVFPAPGGGPMHQGNFRRRIFHPLVAAAGVRPVDLYDLRHAANALQGHIGAPIAVASRRMGHASIQQTVDTYGHYFDADDQDVADRLQGYLERSGLG